MFDDQYDHIQRFDDQVDHIQCFFVGKSQTFQNHKYHWIKTTFVFQNSPPDTFCWGSVWLRYDWKVHNFDSDPHISTSLKLLSSTCQDWCSWKETNPFFHRENGGTLGMLPLIIYKSHIHLIQWVFVGSQSHFKGLQQGELNSYGPSSQKIPPFCWKDPIQNCILKGGICVWSHWWRLNSCSTWDV